MTDKEKKVINKFRNTSIPTVFKYDNTDFLLFLERLDFDICKYLQRGKAIPSVLINSILDEYSRFSKIYYIGLYSELDSYLLMIKEVIDIMRNYYIS